MTTKKASEKKKPEEVEVIEVSEKDLVVQHTTPADIISLAISGGADLDKIERLMKIQHEWEENQAKKAYTVAMAAFKENPPRIEKTKQVSFKGKSGGMVNYKHALLADAAELINKALSKHGLSAAWIPSQDKNLVKVTCTITHKLGHSESCTLEAAPDATGNKNAIQQVGSTISYLERYTILALSGLSTHDMDDDGRGSSGPVVKYISDAQHSELHALLTDNGLIKNEKYMGQFLAYMQLEAGEESIEKDLEEILAKDFGKAKAAIMAAIKQVKK